MSTPDPRLTRRDAERLLDDPTAVDTVLAQALRAAAAPARPRELSGEDAVAAVFQAARLTPPPTHRSDFVSPTRLGSRAATRAVIATGAIVALTSGGFALANSAHLPILPDQASDQATESVAKTPKPSETTASETPTETPTETPVESTDAADPSTAPTPNLEGLCKAFQATDRSDKGSSLDSAAFTALATAAGSVDGIATYCVGLIGEPQQTGKPSDKPTPTAKPTPTDTGKPETPGQPDDAGKPDTEGDETTG
jgi:cell division protein FtsN